MQSTFPLLSLAIWVPIAFGVFVLAFGRDANPNAVRAASLIGAIASFLVTLPIVATVSYTHLTLPTTPYV